MRFIKLQWVLAIILMWQVALVQAQQKEASPYDFGKMWTFENPPKDWFKEAYDFAPEDEWWDDVRKSSLRFASWCSASFVSPDGLIMTNHHCSRDESIKIQKEGERFDKNGFVASSRADERKADGLFVEQLLMTADITEAVKDGSKNAENEAQAGEMRAKALEDIKAKYAEMEGWEGLRMQVVTYYSGGKYSLYGYKKYDDIRLVFIPELDLGFFGGDPDNFTYPRYNLDCTFWRAYDENGEPVNTSEHYYKFNIDGIHADEPVFVIGNPGTTERYRTVAQLEYDRDYRYPMQLKFMTNRHDIFVEEYEQNPSEELLGTIFGLSNGMKAIGGIIKGLNTPDLFNRKVDMETKIRDKSPGVNHWDDLDAAYEKLNPHAWAIRHLQPNGLHGKTLALMHQAYAYEQSIEGDASDEELEEARNGIAETMKGIDSPEEQRLFKLLLTEIQEDIYPGDNSLKEVLDGKSIDAFVASAMKDSKFLDEKKAMKCLKKKKIKKEKGPLLRAARILVPKYNDAVTAFSGSSPYRRGLEEKISNQVFNVYGTSLPPDATFTLRISDGVVKSYEYNGTTAPVLTTYFGLYDRHYSHNQETPWSLPEKWQNPPMELLQAPLNFVSTNDIIGGNSGSAIVNRNKEAVGLIFDGNMESLPGRFIFDEESNRSVSVHTGGMVAALKYIYKAEALVEELTK